MIITDSPGYIQNSGVGFPIGDPCHCYTHCSVVVKYNKFEKYKRDIWLYKYAHFKELKKDLDSCPWETMDIFDDVNDMENYFNQIFVSTCKQHIPCKQICINPKDKPWMNPDIKYKLKIRNRWHKKWKSNSSELNHQTYKTKRHEANIAMRMVKRSILIT